VTHRSGFNVRFTLLVWIVVLGAAPAAWASTFTVTRTDDPVPGTCDIGDCSLREAIIAANAAPGADRIVLGSGLTYNLTLGPADASGALTAVSGDLDIVDALTIDGNGSVVDAGGLDRVLDIQGSFLVTINNLSIRFGSASVRTTPALSMARMVAVTDAGEPSDAVTLLAATSARP